MLEELSRNRYDKVTFFASTEEGGDFKDLPDKNWPLMSVLVELKNLDAIVFDGVFLFSTRHSAYLDVKKVLDAAVAASTNGRIFYAPERLPFTSGKDENVAAADMRALHTKQFDAVSRPHYFKLLSPSMTEQDFA